MDIAQFLARVVPPGNFLTVSVNYDPTKPGMFGNRMFPHGAFSEAAGYIRWASNKGLDAYFALASYRMAEPKTDARGNVTYKGKREASNTMALRAFWVDLDVSRPGDKKAAGAAFPTKEDAIAWVANFNKTVGMPKPNMMVYSGYGIHVYWVCEDPMATADWQPYADALKAALQAQGFKGDAGISADAARILRPPGTINAKAVPHMPVTLEPRVVGGEIPNQVIFTALKPYLGMVQTRSTTGVLQSQQAASALGGGGGNITSIFAGQANAAAAAQANVPANARPRHFAKIATRCKQVEQSLAEHGANDMYPLWYLGNLTLAHFCVDGDQYVHPISDGHPAYQASAIDARMQQVAAEAQSKGNGPPSCAVFDRGRAGVCQTCPFFNKVRSPWDLGIEDTDLPDGYRRHQGWIEHETWDATAKDYVWKRMVLGDFADPKLDELALGGYGLHFNYLRNGRLYPIYIESKHITGEAAILARELEPQFLLLVPGSEASMKKFIVAWIDHLRDRNQARTNASKPFGWAKEQGKLLGFAVGGTLYRSDGSESTVPTPDKALANAYKPQGDLATWKLAADTVMAGNPALQVVVATAFAAPLVTFTGHSGAAASIWSARSGAGKSSALRVAQTVWSHHKQALTMNDTANSVLHKLGQTRQLPALWDECRVRAGHEAAFVDMIFSLVQGREKARMRSDVTLRESGEWETLLVLTGNRALIDYVAGDEGTDAGALRLFEFNLEPPATPFSASASATIAKVDSHYGHAGRAYAAWLAANAATAEKAVHRAADWFVVQTQAMQEERFLIAFMATTLAGALLAKQLGLADFDLAALRQFLVDSFMLQRHDRSQNTLMKADGTLDLDDIFARYFVEMGGRRLVTDQFQRPNGPRPKIIWHPQAQQSAVVHASQRDGVIRLIRAPFREWCLRHRLSYTVVSQQAQKQWHARIAKLMFAGGVGGHSNHTMCIDIPVRPELDHMLYLDPNAQAAAQPAPPIPQRPAQAPNAPKV